jgi:hypothetical protein
MCIELYTIRKNMWKIEANLKNMPVGPVEKLPGYPRQELT